MGCWWRSRGNVPEYALCSDGAIQTPTTRPVYSSTPAAHPSIVLSRRRKSALQAAVPEEGAARDAEITWTLFEADSAMLDTVVSHWDKKAKAAAAPRNAAVAVDRAGLRSTHSRFLQRRCSWRKASREICADENFERGQPFGADLVHGWASVTRGGASRPPIRRLACRWLCGSWRSVLRGRSSGSRTSHPRTPAGRSRRYP